MSRAQHWNSVYSTRGPEQMSWFQANARLSRKLINMHSPSRKSRIVDIGAGVTALTRNLLDDGYGNLSSLDISGIALKTAQTALKERAALVTWIEADVLELEFEKGSFDVWHDRAVFHFLTDESDRSRYVQQARDALTPGGILVIATFAEDGPLKCSGLDVMRHSPLTLGSTLSTDFELVESERELHTTPSGATQAFTYGVFRRVVRLSPGV